MPPHTPLYYISLALNEWLSHGEFIRPRDQTPIPIYICMPRTQHNVGTPNRFIDEMKSIATCLTIKCSSSPRTLRTDEDYASVYYHYHHHHYHHHRHCHSLHFSGCVPWLSSVFLIFIVSQAVGSWKKSWLPGAQSVVFLQNMAAITLSKAQKSI